VAAALDRDLSREDARQIAENITGFFSVLADWSRAEMPSPANDTGKRAASNMNAETIADARGGHQGAGGRTALSPAHGHRNGGGE
jgi:hypothetical protein